MKISSPKAINWTLMQYGYTIAGAINLVFIAYPQKYENCSTLAGARQG
jgi:hypothetical protein